MGVATGRPAGCVDCVFWQARAAGGSTRSAGPNGWRTVGRLGTLYHAEANRLLGFVQYGPSGRFPRASELPAGPPSPDAVLVTCAYLVDASSPWVLQSLFLAAIGGPATVASRPSRRSATPTRTGDELQASARPQNDLPGLPGGLRLRRGALGGCLPGPARPRRPAARRGGPDRARVAKVKAFRRRRCPSGRDGLRLLGCG